MIGGFVNSTTILSWNSECAQKPLNSICDSSMPPVYDWWFLTFGRNIFIIAAISEFNKNGQKNRRIQTQDKV